MHARSTIAGLAGALVLIFGACGHDHDGSDEAAAPSDGHTHSHSDSGHSHDLGETGENYAFTLGEPGDPSAVTRTVAVKAGKGLRFDPKTLEVSVGDTVTFVVENVDKMPHEFVLGNAQYQDLHETQMKAGGVHHEHGAFSIALPPGQTGEVTWTFTQAGLVQFGCHVAGHYKGGMVGDIKIS
jgi:uncharacterized cupredoxin-like copper-binding protein